MLLKLMQLADLNNSIAIKQVELAKMLNLKNKSNVNVAIAELLEKGFIKKKTENKKTTYYLNPSYHLTTKGFTELQENYKYLNLDLESMLNNLNADFNLKEVKKC